MNLSIAPVAPVAPVGKGNFFNAVPMCEAAEYRIAAIIDSRIPAMTSLGPIDEVSMHRMGSGSQ